MFVRDRIKKTFSLSVGKNNNKTNKMRPFTFTKLKDFDGSVCRKFTCFFSSPCLRSRKSPPQRPTRRRPWIFLGRRRAGDTRLQKKYVHILRDTIY